MNDIARSKIRIFLHVILCVPLLCSWTALPGCRKDSPKKDDKDPVVYVIKKAVKSPEWPQEVRDRANIAISKWENGRVDPEPILISACLFSYDYEGEEKETLLALTIFAERNGIIGFGTEEVHIQANGQKKNIREEYPCYIHYPLSDIVNVWIFPAQIRIKDVRKDEQIWKEYVECTQEQLLQKYKDNEEVLKYDLGDYASLWDAIQPPAYVSVPEPNKVDVSIWVYDKAGNKSEPVKLLYTVRTEEIEEIRL